MKMDDVSNTNPSSRRLRLWLVDDDDGLRGLIAELLGRSDIIECSRQFFSAESALDVLAQESPPDIILLDLNMPGMSGVEAIRPIKRLAGGTRVFIMTVFYDSIEVSRARSAGASGFVLKRDDWQEVIARLQDESADWAAESPKPGAPASLPARSRMTPGLQPYLAGAEAVVIVGAGT